MKILRNERGMALVTSLILMMIALAITMAILYMVVWQTKLSGAHKRYRTAIEASQGGVEIFAKQIIPQVFTNFTSGMGTQFNFVWNGGNLACFSYKLNNATAKWGTICGSDPARYDATQNWDVTFTLPGTNANYNVYAKIVDTIPGNSDTSGMLLDSGLGVAGQSSDISPKHIPALYRIEVQGQQVVNPREKAKLSVLYGY